MNLLLCGDAVQPWVVVGLAVLGIGGWLVLDLGMWLGSQGMQFNWPMLWLVHEFAYPHTFPDPLPAMQVWCAAVYIGCGLAKIGPWWAVGFGVEWTLPPPFAGCQWLTDAFVRDSLHGDHRATPFAAVAAHASAIVEAGSALLLLLGDESLRSAGLLSLMAMHVYIVSHFAHADVYTLNWIAAHTLYFCHAHHTFHGLGGCAPLPLAILALDLLYALHGQLLGTHTSVQSMLYKYWAGNYSHVLYCFSPAGKTRLDERIADRSSVLHQLGPCGLDNLGPAGTRFMPTEQLVRWNGTRLLGALWHCQLVMRIFPKLLQDHHASLPIAVQRKQPPLSLADMTIVHNLMLHQWLMGVVSHEPRYHVDVLSFLQRECGFEEGELTCVCVYAYPSLSHLFERSDGGSLLDGRGRWLIRDALRGLVRQGTQSSQAVAERIRRPSDLQHALLAH